VSRTLPNMTSEPHSEPLRNTRPARSFRQRLGGWTDPLRFAWSRCSSLRDAARLFHYLKLKPALAFRGWSTYSPERLVSFSIKATGPARYRVYVRDNGLDAGTIAEFFVSDSSILPVGLPPLCPRVVYDVGANIGIASLRFATLYPGARFYGFEPLPSNHAVCVRNYENLAQAQAFPWALGARSEVTSFECNDDPRGGHLQATPGSPNLQARQRINVQVHSILDLVQVHKLEPPEFVKIDVEGAEMEVLRGMGEVVQSVKRLFVETHGAALRTECLAWMQQAGFKIWPAQDPTALWGDRP
jgi:FkbM family methyltransferase